MTTYADTSELAIMIGRWGVNWSFLALSYSLDYLFFYFFWKDMARNCILQQRKNQQDYARTSTTTSFFFFTVVTKALWSILFNFLTWAWRIRPP